MTCHLEAHEGATHYMNRNKNLAEIFAGAKTDPNYYLHDATIISHHLFVCGDLTSRINFRDGKTKIKKAKSRIQSKLKASGVFSKKHVASVTSGSFESPDEDAVLDEKDEKDKEKATDSKNPANGSHFAEAMALIAAEDWKALNEGDELAMALRKKEFLAGFRTLPCNFPPTFKVARGEGYQYNKKRTPR